MTTGSLYLDSIKAGAIRGWIEERIPASLTGAQAALESGWGTSSLARAPHNNQFGIKASADWTGRVVKMPTKEYLNGSWTTVNADFRAYDDINDSVADHAKFFTSTEWRKSNYKAVIGETDYKKACYAVKAAGYATDPDYASKLINIIEKYKLYEWDKEAQSGTVPTASEDVEVVSNLQPKSKIVGGDLSEAGRAFGKQTGVSVIGDSLGVGTEPHLVKLIPNSNYDVKGSRQITHSDSSLNGTVSLQNMKNAGKLKDNVVVILGTNRGLTAGEIDTFMSICGPERKVLWVETASAVRHNLSANEEMRKAATRHKNAFVLGWYEMVGGLRKEYYGSDDIHMTYMGYFNHAKAIVQGVYEMSTGDFDSSVAETTTMQFEGIKGFKLSENGKLEYTDENKVKQVIQTEFRGLSTDGKSNYIYNVSANNAYNPQTGATEADWLEGRFESSDLKGLDLFMAACRDMMNRGEPEATYRVVLSELPEGIEIGAEGTIVDTASNPPRYITARVSEITTSQTNPEYNEVVITNVVEVKPFEKPTTLLIQEELRKNRDKLDTDYKERILETDLNSMGGLVLATEDSETTLIADVEVDGEDVTEHYSDFRWERQSNNAESDKHYNEILSKTENGMTLNISDKDIEGEESNFICRIYDDAGNLVRTIMKKMVSQVKIKKEIDTVLDRFDTERTETEQAINEALSSAKAEAKKLDEERQVIIDGKFEEVNQANEKLEQSIATAEQNAQSALQKAGSSDDLAKTAKEASENAIANLGEVKTELGEVKNQASDSIVKAQEAINTAGTLSTQVKTYEETVDGYKSEVANYSRTNETLTAKVKSYEETVDGYTQSLSRVEGKVDNLQVGGKNLIKGTDDLSGIFGTGYNGSVIKYYNDYEINEAEWGQTTNATRVVITQAGGVSGAFSSTNHFKMIFGKSYTVSFYVKNLGQNRIRFSLNGLMLNPDGTGPQSIYVEGGESGKFSATGYMRDNPDWNWFQILPMPSDGITSMVFAIAYLQVEEGTFATDWDLAPEEKIDTSTFKNYQNQVKSTTEEHTRRLTALDGTGGRISKVEQTATQIQRSLSNYAQTTYVDTKITEKAGEITTNLTRIEGKFDDLQISGRNYIKDSYEERGDNHGYGITNLVITNPSELENSPVIVSFEAKHNEGNRPIPLHVYYRHKDGSNLGYSYGKGQTTTKEYKRFEIPIDSNKIPSNMDGWINLAIRNGDPSDRWSIRKIKLEKGNKATDWTMAEEDKVTKTEFQTVKETTSLYERIIGKTETNIKSNIAKITMTDSLFQTEVSKNTDLTNTKSQVTQLSNSWALTLKSGNDIKTAINATTDGIRLKGSLITLDGQVYMTSSFIVPEGNIGALSAGKITSGTIDSARIDAKQIVTNGLQANVIKSTHILADNALFEKLFTNDLATQNLATKRAWIKSGMIGDAQIGTAQIGQIDAGTGKIVNIDAQYITANHAKLVSAGFKGLNSNMHIDGGAIRINNSDGDFATMNAIPEFRSQDSAGTSAILGKGRSQYYSNSQSRFYIGSSLNGDEVDGKVVHGVHISKGQTWGIYRQSDAFGGTPAQYFKTPAGWGAVNVVEELMRTGKVVNNFNQASALIRSLNGWGNSWPVLQPGDMVMYQAAVAGNSSGIERIWTMGNSSNGTTRTYSHVHHVFEGGTTGVSDERLKHDIKPTDIKALDHISKLAFKQFKWNRNDEVEPLGLIAQESGILRVPDAEMEGIDIQRAIMLALKGIQELSQKLEKMGA